MHFSFNFNLFNKCLCLAAKTVCLFYTIVMALYADPDLAPGTSSNQTDAKPKLLKIVFIVILICFVLFNCLLEIAFLFFLEQEIKANKSWSFVTCLKNLILY